MKKLNFIKKSLCILFSFVLIAAMALNLTACKDKGSESSSASTPEGVSQKAEDASVTELGEGEKTFDFSVVDKEGNKTDFKISTDKETVGEALLELGLISEEEGPYGLFVKEVNGKSAEFEKDGVYWAFYVNEEYSNYGVSSTKIVDGESYAFKISK